MAWEKLIKRQPRGHPENIRRIQQLVEGKGGKTINGEVYVDMEVKDEQVNKDRR